MPKPSIEFDALGTHWWIELLGGEESGDIEAKINARVATFNDYYSRFLPTSFIGRLNAHKKLLNPPRELLRMLEFAQEMYEISDGIFNISVGGTLVQLGYGKGKSGARLSVSLWDKMTINKNILIIPADVELDFGGFGKGWLIDELGKLLKTEGHEHFVVNGGGDILVSSSVPIELALEHPIDSTLMIGTTRIQQGALAVSSAQKRAWKKAGTAHHHIIDPRRGTSSQSSVVASYIKAESALIADTMATILFIAPNLEEKLRTQYHLEVILLDDATLAKS